MNADHQFQIRGTSKRGVHGWRTHVGREVPPAAGKYIQQLFERPLFAAVRVLGQERRRESFLDELQLRDFDLSTLRLSVFQTGHGRPRKPRILRLRDATLHARWGRADPGEPGDLCSCWSAPVRRADSSLFMGLFSLPTCFEPLQTDEALRNFTWVSALERLRELGWDMRTFEFSVRHKGWLYRPDWAGQDKHLMA